MPTVGAIIAELYERTTGDRIDGVVAADPLAVAEILRVTGPIQAGGGWLDADNVAEETLVRAYVRYQTDTNARRQFLREVATASFEAFRRGLTTEPVNLIRHLPAETYLDQDPATDSLADSPPRANSTIRAGHPCSLVILDRRGAIGGCGGRNQTDRRGVAGWSWTGPDRLLPALACSPVGAVTALAAAMLAPTGPAGRRATSPGLAGAVVVPTQCPRAGPSWAEGTPWLAGGTGRSSGAQQAAHLVVLVCSGQPLRDDPRRQASPLPLPGPTKVSVAATLVSIVGDRGLFLLAATF